MSKPTSREHELSGIVIAQDRQIAALNKRLAALLADIDYLKSSLDQAYHDNQSLIDQINEA